MLSLVLIKFLHDLGVLTVVMFHELGITIWFFGVLAILCVVVQKGKSRMVPGSVHPLKIMHQSIVTCIVDGRMPNKELFKGMVVQI